MLRIQSDGSALDLLRPMLLCPRTSSATVSIRTDDLLSKMSLPNVMPTRSLVAPSPSLRLEDFAPDQPHLQDAPREGAREHDPFLVDGVRATALMAYGDARGSLCEIPIASEEFIEPIVHVYQVTAAPGSIRAWIYHERQFDRLAFTNGDFEVVLYDLRPNSSTYNCLNVFMLGARAPCLLRLPPLVVHGVMNRGSDWSSFLNMPTRPYDRTLPDKRRLAADDQRIPHAWQCVSEHTRQR
jgi:dTDP-4-dehydrorhamnose 3,5-epimerase